MLIMWSYVYVVITATLWSLNPAVIQKFGKNSKPMTITVFRAFAALALLIPLAFVNGIHSNFNLYAISVAIASGIIGPGIGDTVYTRSIQLIGGSLAAIISYTYIFVAQILAFLILRESIEISIVVGGILAFLGIVVALYDRDRGFSKTDLAGVLYTVITAITWGISATLIKLATVYLDPLTLAIIRLSSMSTALSIFMLIFEKPRIRREVKNIALISITTGILSWGVGLYLFHYSIALVGVSRTVIAIALTPILSQVIVKLVTKERIGVRNIIGAILVAIGILISSIPSLVYRTT